MEYKILKCRWCGWVYDEAVGDPNSGLKPRTLWENVPDDWFCPDCGTNKKDFHMEEK
jgi:rubredoxin-NAD+ reductase